MVKNKLKIYELAKGFLGRGKNCVRLARPRVHKALQYAYAHRRTKKREMRKLWIQRINAGTRYYGVSYSRFIWGLDQSAITLNRKILSNLSVDEPFSFRAVVEAVHSLASLPTTNFPQHGEKATTIVLEKQELPLQYSVNYRHAIGTGDKISEYKAYLETNFPDQQIQLKTGKKRKEGEYPKYFKKNQPFKQHWRGL